MLAVAGDKGVSREKLLAMLWPDGNPEKSRHALNQIFSAQRRYFSDSQLFDGKKTVRLNNKLITSDVSAFEHALSDHDLDAAVDIHGGPFLDGFFVSDSSEFEKWATDQRERFTSLLSNALDDDARQAESASDFDLAIKRRRQSVMLDRLDAMRAIKLADALSRAGDAGGALRSLQECQKRMKDELGFSDPVLSKRISALALELDGRR